MRIRSVGAELFHADGQTDMTKLVVALLNFANPPKDGLFFSLRLCSLQTCHSSLHLVGGRNYLYRSSFRCWYASILDVVLRLELKPRDLECLHFRADGTTPAGPFATFSLLQHFILLYL